MKNSRTLMIVLVAVVSLLAASASFADVVIICNKSVNNTSLSNEEIKQIFLGKKTKWNDSRKIHFAVMQDGEIHKNFLKQYVQKTASQYNLYWKKQIFTGKARQPKQFQTADELIRYVAKTEGAIGYVGNISGQATVTLEALASEIKSINYIKTIKLSYLRVSAD